MRTHVRIGAAALFTLALMACKDLAQPSFEEAQRFENKQQYGAAQAHYEIAVKADPTSTYGRKAAERLVEVKAMFQKAEKERVEAEGYARQARADLAKEARSRVHRSRSDALDGSCAGQGKPRRGYRYEGATYDENGAVAQADGCVPESEPVGWKGFVCCP